MFSEHVKRNLANNVNWFDDSVEFLVQTSYNLERRNIELHFEKA